MGMPLMSAPIDRVHGANGANASLVIGEWAIAIGNPFGYLFSDAEPTVTAGVVSALGRHLIPSSEQRGFYLGMVQTDASINPGNSGGPLVNALGEVVGINCSIFSRSGGSEGLGFAIPIDRALRIADDLIRFGEVRRAWLGFEVQPVNADEFGRTRAEIRIEGAGGRLDPISRSRIRAVVELCDTSVLVADLDLRVEDDGRVCVSLCLPMLTSETGLLRH